MQIRSAKILLLGILCVGSFSVHAKDEELGNYAPISSREGFYAGLSTGKIFFTGSDRQLYTDAWVVGLKAGYDLFQYFGFELQLKYSAHDTTLLAPSATTPTAFTALQLIGAGKVAYPVLRRLKLGITAGGGFFYSTPSMQSIQSQARAMGYGSLDIEYFMRIKGMSIGLDPSIALVQNLQSAIIQTTGFVRYTF